MGPGDPLRQRLGDRWRGRNRPDVGAATGNNVGTAHLRGPMAEKNEPPYLGPLPLVRPGAQPYATARHRLRLSSETARRMAVAALSRCIRWASGAALVVRLDGALLAPAAEAVVA